MRTIFPDSKKDSFISSFLGGTFRGILAAFPLILTACSGGSIHLNNQVIPAPYAYSFPVCDTLAIQQEFSTRGIITRDGFIGNAEILFFADQSGRIVCLDAVTLEEVGMLQYKKSSVLFKPLLFGDMVCFARFKIDEHESVITFYDYRKSKEVTSYTIEGIALSQFQAADGTISYLTSTGKRLEFSTFGQLLSDQKVVNFSAYQARQSDSIAVFIGTSGDIEVYVAGSRNHIIHESIKDVSHIEIAGSKFLVVGRDGRINCYQTGFSSPIFQGVLDGRPSGVLLHDNKAWVVTYSGSLFQFSFEENILHEAVNLQNIVPSGIAELNDQFLVVYGLHGDFFLIDGHTGIPYGELYQTGIPIDAAPVLREGRLIIGHRDGMVRTYSCE